MQACSLVCSLTHSCDLKILAETTIPPTAFNGEAKWIIWPIGPVAVGPPTHELDQEYMVTVSTGTEKGHHWSGCPACNAAAGGNGKHLAFPANSARFGPAMGQMPETTPQFGQSYFRDVVFCPDPGPCGPLPPPPPPPHPANVVVAGPVFVERWDGVAAIGLYRAQVVDQFGTPITGQVVKWALEGEAPAGVSLVADAADDGGTATLTVASTVAGDVVLNVTANDASVQNVTTRIAVTVAYPRPNGVTVSGPTALDAAIGTTFRYTAIVCDQGGKAVAPQLAVTWSLAQPAAGVNVQADGTVQLGSGVVPGVFTLVAKTASGGLSGMLRVTLDHFKVNND